MSYPVLSLPWLAIGGIVGGGQRLVNIVVGMCRVLDSPARCAGLGSAGPVNEATVGACW